MNKTLGLRLNYHQIKKLKERIHGEEEKSRTASIEKRTKQTKRRNSRGLFTPRQAMATFELNIATVCRDKNFPMIEQD